MLFKHWKSNPRVFCNAPDDDPGAPPSDDGQGGSATPPPPPPPDKTFTQKQKDADEAKLRRRYEREIKELKKKAEEQAAALAEMKKQRETQPPPSPTPSDGTEEGRIELLEKRWKRTEQELKEQIDSAKAAAEKEKQTRLNLERDRLLDDAIRESGVAAKHAKQARRYFMPQVEWDELDECWMFRTAAGNLVPIADGVAEELPDNLRPSKMKHGGAGNTAGLPAAKARRQQDLDAAKKKLKELEVAFHRSGGKQTELMAWNKQKKVVRALEEELTAPK